MSESSTHNPSAENLQRLIAAGRQDASRFAESTLVEKPPAGAIPGFEIMAEIGRGGMGVVYKAMQLSAKRIVALKIMLGAWFASASARKRFQREVELTARLQHAGIVRVLESGLTTTGQQYYAMDCVEGDRLDTWLTASAPDTRSILQLFRDVCQAVDHAHQHGVIHRDLKPGNVLVDADGQPHVLDFGLAKATDRVAAEDTLSATMSLAGQVVGTPRYLSPEQAAGEPGEVDARSDVYALGIMLYEALTGSLPFDPEGGLSAVMQRIREDPPRPPSRVSPRVGRELEKVLLQALEKEKNRRYQSAGELADDIGRYLRGDPLWAHGPSRLYVARKRVAKHRGQVVGVAVTMLTVIAAVWGLSQWQAAEQRRQRGLERASARSRLLSVQLDLDAGRSHEAAIGDATEVRAKWPEIIEAWLIEAHAKFRLAQRTGNLMTKDNVIGSLNQAADGQPEVSWAFVALLADIYAEIGNPLASELEQQAAQEAPDTAEAWYLRSFATLRRDWALQCTQRAVDRQPRGPLAELAWARLAGLQEQIRDYDGALQAARKLNDLHPDQWQWLLLEGKMLARLNRYQEAADALSQAVRAAPHLAQTHYARAGVSLCQGAYAEAVEEYSRAAELSSGQALWSIYRRATVYWIAEELDAAEADYRTFCERRGHVSYGEARLFLLLHDRVRRLRGAGHTAEAARVEGEAAHVLKRSLPRVAEDTWLRSVFACLAGEVSPAGLVAEARKGGGLSQFCEACYYAGEVCLLNGQNDEAWRLFRDCVDTGLVFDPVSPSLDPMNEWHLARWRLENLSTKSSGGDAGTP